MSFTLQKYKGRCTRQTCPQCGTKGSFVRYINNDTGEIIHPNVGRCNREVKCGYHLNPKKFFTAQGIDYPVQTMKITALNATPLPTSYINERLLRESLKGYEQNHLVAFLKNLPGSGLVDEVVKKYFVGTSKHWPGSSVFWQVDKEGKIRAGKIMDYDERTGHRIKKPFPRITWVHSLLSLTPFNLQQCFFGEHLLTENPTEPVYIVESEKTALIASICIPNVNWLATGGKNGCRWTTPEVNKVLKGRKVTLWPDLNAYEDWKQKAEILRKQGIEVYVSDFLEKIATPEQRAEGLDLADYLIEYNQRTLTQQEQYQF